MQGHFTLKDSKGRATARPSLTEAQSTPRKATSSGARNRFHHEEHEGHEVKLLLYVDAMRRSSFVFFMAFMV